jgi:hypothetical protein
MQDTNLIASDLRMCLMEGKRKFDFLNIYRGVQFITEATLEGVFDNQAVFTVESPSSVLLDRDKTSIVLSNGLMDPFMLRVESFDLVSGRLMVTDMAYAGDTVGNRHEHRLEVDPALPVDIELTAGVVRAELVDISLSGAGLHLPMTVSEGELHHGRTAWMTLYLSDANFPDSQLRIMGEFLRFRKIFSHYWLAVKFTAASTGKTPVLHYINRSLGEIRSEVQQMYAAARPNQP